MSANNKITPRKLSGFMELLPQKQLIFDKMKDTIRKVFDNNCFMPLDTPVLEYAEILLAKSGGEIDKEIYHFKKGDTELAMRYDLTVPLARFVASNSENIYFPFKRYQIGKAYRGEKAQKGRFREFYQCDADIIGNENLPIAADAECVNMLNEVYKALGLNDVIINISNRNILFGYIEELGLPERTSTLTMLDKIDKMGVEKVKSELTLLYSNSQIKNIEEKIDKLVALTLKKGTFDSVLSQIISLSQNETYQKGVKELQELDTCLKAYGTNPENIVLNIGAIRGQNYYTGTIFEAYMKSHPEFGAIGSGGRYDNLAEYYTDKQYPGVGMSVGLTRLFDLLDSNNMLPEQPKYPADVIIIPMGDTLPYCLNLLTELKNNEIKCEVNYDERSFKAKMKDANKKQIPYVIIIGENEVKENKLTLKNMLASEQSTLSLAECIKKFKSN